MPIDVMVGFFAASVLLALSPGPDNLFVLVHSALYGPKSGIIIIAGLCSGLLFHTTIVAFGITTLFKNYPMAFMLLKVIGAFYLLYLAWNSFKASVKSTENQEQRKITGSHLYRRGVIMNATNPKVSIFFIAFLPQFTSADYGPLLPQFFILGALFILSALLVFGAISFSAGFISKLLNGSNRALKIMNRIAAAVFAGIALKLVITKM